MSSVLYLTVGLPACGKTTRARQWVADSPLTRARCNRDDFRDMMYGGWTGKPEHEEAVTVAQHVAIRVLLAVGWDVVADDTNLNPVHLAALEEVARQAGAEVEVWDMTDVPLERCIAWDEIRAAYGERAVGEDVIRRLHARWLAPQPVANEPGA